MKSLWIKSLAVLGIVLALASCSSGGSCKGCSNGGSTPTPPGPSGLSLSLTAPDQYPAGIAVTAYLTITNTSNVNATNLVYSIPNDYNNTGANITVSNLASSNPCLNIAAGQSCTFPAQIAANPPSHPGSFRVDATSSSGSSGSASSNGLISVLKSAISPKATTLSLTANIGLTNLSANSQTGANGISFLYSHIIAASESGPTQIAIVGVVNSANAGSFNTINLTDSSGNPLNFKVLSGNSGSGLTNLTQGSIVTFLLYIPNGLTSYQFYAQTVQNGATVDTSSNMNLIGLSGANQGVLQVQPTSFSLRNGYNSQSITYTNIGNSPITALTITTESPVVNTTSTCNGSLAAGSSCSYTVTFDSTLPLAGTSYIKASYNDGIQNLSQQSIADYRGTNATGILITAQDDQGLNFVTTTVTTTNSKQITLTNFGDVNESNFKFNLPSGFSLEAGLTNSCILNGNTVTDTLTPYTTATSSCNLTLKYTGTTNITPVTTTTMNVDYSANNNTITSPNVVLSYATIQAQALLNIISPSIPYTFQTIRENAQDESTQVILVKNVGDVTATNLNNSGGSIARGSIREGGELFTVVPSSPSDANDCMTNIQSLAPNATCQITIKFGPTGGSNTGFHTFSTQIFYTPYVSAPQASVTATVNGTVRTYTSAEIYISNVSFTPAAQGTGIQYSTPYQLEANGGTTPMVITIKNRGADSAKNLQFPNTTIDGNYTLTANSCNGINLASGATCTLSYNVNSTALGHKDIDLTTQLLASWVDDGSTYTGIGLQYVNPANPSSEQPGIYVNVYLTPTVNAVLSNESSGTPTISQVNTNSDFYVVFTLSGGYNVSSTNYTATAPSGFNPTTGNCNISSTNTMCAVKFTAPATASTGNIISATGQNLTLTPVPFIIDVITPRSYMFITKTSPNGSMVSTTYTPSGSTGIARADQICQHDAADITWIPASKNAGTKTWKAMIVAAGQRVAAPVGSQLNWVLKPSTTYYNIMSDNEIGTTTSNSIFNLSNGGSLISNFGQSTIAATKLTSYMVPNYPAGTYGGIKAWTGLNTNWTTNNAANCSNWSDDSWMSYGTPGSEVGYTVGSSPSWNLYQSAISNGTLSCDTQANYNVQVTLSSLICVSQ